jgi:hypothetical protein
VDEEEAMEKDGGDDDGDKQHPELVQDLVQMGVGETIEACVPVLALVRHMLYKNVEVHADRDISVYVFLSMHYLENRNFKRHSLYLI